MRSLIELQEKFAVRYRPIYIALRTLRQKLWLLPGVGKFLYPVPEIRQLQEIVECSDPGLLRTDPSGARILFFSFRGGWSTNMGQDLVLAQALRMRGANPFFVTCSSYLPICDLANRNVAPPMPCDFCTSYAKKMVALLQFPLIHLKDFLSPEDRAQARAAVEKLPVAARDDFEYQGVPVGRLIKVSVPRFLLRSTIDKSEFADDIWRRYLISGATLVPALRQLLDREKPDMVWTMNGLFFSEAILHWLSKERNISILDYEGGYRPGNHIIIARNQIAGYYYLDSHWPAEKERSLTPTESERIETYLRKRRTGKDAIVSTMYPTMQTSREAITAQLGLDPQKPIVLLLTNVVWDSSVVNRDGIFNNISQWLEMTLEHFCKTSDKQLIVRVHPGEISAVMRRSVEQMTDVIRNRFPALPPNIKIIEPSSKISSYTLMDMACCGLIYASITGVEMVIAGKPVIVSGETHYAKKGFTYDPTDKEQYIRWLNHLDNLAPPTPEQIQLALHYAYLLFFRVPHPYPFVSTLSQRRIVFHFSRLEELGPGNPYLDPICDKILHDPTPGMLFTDIPD